jgi:5-methyltetrahydrofolate--homocysteine methyltransferase
VGSYSWTYKTTGWISPSEEDPVARNLTVVGWWRLASRRSCQQNVETIFDTLNAKAAMYAVGEILKFSGLGFLGFITGTLVEHLDVRCRVDQCDILCLDKDAKPMCESLNSSRLRTQHLVPFVEKLANFVECFMHVKSNAGLPYNRRV